MNETALANLQGFLAQLLHREQEIDPTQIKQSLVFADSLILSQLVKPQLKDLPPQVAVIGPTQAGKSSVVNVLLGQPSATASPLAGYTRHAQGFINREVDAKTMAAIDALLPHLTRVPRKSLSNDDLHQYSLSEIPSVPGEPVRIFWDTPDFDSVSSRSYRSTVPMLCAVSDLLVMVVSREKYADQSVWELLKLLAPAGQPTVLCVNKTQAETRNAILGAVHAKLEEAGLQGIDVVALPYLHDENKDQLAETPAADILREHASALIEDRETRAPTGSPEAFIKQHWEDWVEGIVAEHRAALQWRGLVTEKCALSLEFYRDQYLDEPRHTHALEKTMVRLLELLEIPGVGGPLGKIRSVITWPMRQLGGFIKKQDDDEPPVDGDPESRILEQGIRHAFLELSREAGDLSVSSSGSSQAWWQALLSEFNQSHHELEEQLDSLIILHQEAFNQHIEEAANQLYTKLKEHPLTLNGLRAARATTDAAAVVMSLKSGGIGLHDLVLTPAMLAFSSLLAEGALGQYMNKVEKSLREKQLESVREHLIRPIEASLSDHPDEMDKTGLYVISEADLSAANHAIEELT